MDNSKESLEEIELLEQEEIEVEEDEDDSNEKSIPKRINKKNNNEIQQSNRIKNAVKEDKKENNIIKEIKEKNINEIQKAKKIINRGIKNDIQTENKFNYIINQSKEMDTLINEPNLELKLKGYIKLRELLLNLDSNIILNNFDLFFVYIQDKLKNFQTMNLIILKEGIECICTLFEVASEIDDSCVEKIDRKYLNILLSELYEKIKSPNIKSSYIKLLNILIDTFSGLIFFDSLFRILSEVDKISLLKEYAIFIKNYLNNINLNNLNQKININKLIEFCINIISNENPQLKNISTEIINIIYGYLDNSLKKYIKDNNIKIPSINCKDKNPIKKDYITEDNNENNDVNINSDINNENNNINNKDFNRRDDVSFEITQKLLTNINYGNWNEKKEGVEYIHKVLNSHGNYILIDGLNDLIEIIIDKLTDSNTNLVRLIIELLIHLIESLGSQLKPYTKAIIEPLLANLSNKNKSFRKECVKCINKWVEIIQNFGIVCSYIPQLLLNENYDMRNELLNILIDNNSYLNKKISNLFYNDISNSLLICLQDKSSTIKNKAEKIILNLKPFIKEENYIKNCEKFKQIISEYLEQIIKNIYRGENNKKKEIDNNKRNLTDSNNNRKNLFNLSLQKPNLNIKTKSLKKDKNSSNTKGINIEKTYNSFFAKTTSSFECNSPKLIQIKKINKSKIKNIHGCIINLDNMSNITEQNNLPATPGNHKLITVNKKNNLQYNNNKLILAKNQNKFNKIRNDIFFKEKINLSLDQHKYKFDPVENISKDKTKHKHHKNNFSSIKKKIENTILEDIKKNSTTERINFNVFLKNYKIIQGSKLKRLEEDKKLKFYFEYNNFDYLPKIKEEMKDIYSSSFISNLYSDNDASIITCINQLTKYLLNEENNTTIRNLEVNFKNIVENFDLFLKVIGEKITTNKTSSIIVSFLDYIKLYLKYCKFYNVVIHEIESNILLNIFTDNLINSTNIIRDTSQKMIFELNEIIGIETTFLILIHLYDYKNTNIKSELINIYNKLYSLFLQENKENNKETINQFKIKIAKNMIQIYCTLELNQKNKLFFMIKDIYINLKDDFLKLCKDLNPKKKDELIKEMKDKNSIIKKNVKTEVENIHEKTNNINYKKHINKLSKQNTKGKELVKMRSTRINKVSNDNTNKSNSSNNFFKINEKSFNKNNENILNRTDFLKTNISNIKNNNNLITAIKEINKRERKKSVENIKINKNETRSNSKKTIYLKKGEEIRNFRLANKKICFSTNNLNVKKIKQENITNNLGNSEIESKENYKNIFVNLPNKKGSTKLFNKKKVLLNSTKNLKFTDIKNMLEELNSCQSGITDAKLKLNAIFCTNYEINKIILVQNSDYIFNSIIQTINILLNEKPIRIKFLQLILDILCKICNKKEMLSNIQIDTHSNLIFTVLKNISSIDNNQEEEKIINNCLNTIMLKIIDYYDINQNIYLFIQHIKMNLNRNKKTLDYCLKCLILVHENINHFINKINISIFLESINTLLGEFTDVNGKLIIDTKYKKIIVIVLKNLIDGLMDVKGECVYKEYHEFIEKKRLNDKIIGNWMVESLNKNDINNTKHYSSDDGKKIYCEILNMDNNRRFNVHNRRIKRKNEKNEYIDSINSEFINFSITDDDI